MTSVETEMKLLFPTVVRYHPDETKFVGVFKYNETENTLVTFHVPNYPDSKGIVFEPGIRITEDVVRSLKFKAESLNFLEFLKLFSQVVLNAPKQRIFNRLSFARFYYEYQQLKSEYPFDKYYFDREKETFTIVHTDQYLVKNKIVVKLDFYEDDCRIFDLIEHSFPEQKDGKLFHKQASLLIIHKLFLCYVEKLGLFHDTMQKIDSVCWVTAPPNPNYKHEFRTLVIDDENNVSMKITFDPWKMSELPDCKFFGPSVHIEQHRNNLSENWDNWDPSCDVLQNVLKVLDLPFFPIKPVEEDEKPNEIVLYDTEKECFICFAYHLKDEAPDITCEFELCRRQFHNECLYEWLSRLPNCQMTYGSVTGECPNCDKIISCKVPASVS